MSLLFGSVSPSLVETDISTTRCPKRQKRVSDGDRGDENKIQQDDLFTDATAAAAKTIIQALQQVACVPPLLKKGASVDERTLTTDVKGLWVNGKLAKLKGHNCAALKSVESVFIAACAESPESAPESPSSDQECNTREVGEARACDVVFRDDAQVGEDEADRGSESEASFSLEADIQLLLTDAATYESQEHLPMRSNAARWCLTPPEM